MERKEKLEKIIALAKEFGLTYADVMNYWQACGKLETKPLQNETEEASQYQTPEKIMPGMFVYTDGLIYPEIIKGRQIKAVVGYVDGPDVLAVCLRETCLPWSSARLEVPETQDMVNGQKATRKILDISRKKNKKQKLLSGAMIIRKME